MSIGSRLVGTSLVLLIACGGSSDSPSEPAAKAAPSAGGASSAPSAPPSTPPNSDPAPAGGSAEIAALGAAATMVADQLRAACGSSFDACTTTAGCTDILACAAQSACTGAGCYCADARCETPGPCRTVIAAAPGARVPDATNPGLGPAADAANRVGACLQGLAGGAPSSPSATPGPAPSARDAGVPRSKSDAG